MRPLLLCIPIIWRSWNFLLVFALTAVLGSATFFPDTLQAAELREIVDPPVIKITPEGIRAAEQHGVGFWIWSTNKFTAKQTCRVWRAITLPETNRVKSALLRITADNVYRLYVDGQEVGEGGNWRVLTEYDLTFLLTPGRHVLAIDAFNDSLEGGILLGMNIEFADGKEMKILSDESWFVVPDGVSRWQNRKRPAPDWPHARIVGQVGSFPWWLNPIDVIRTPPLRPAELRFWQSAWFLGVVISVLLAALAISIQLATKLAVQTRAQTLLNQERARIARDIHDDLGSALTQLVLQTEVAQTEFPAESTARARFGELCDKARAASHALDEVVWAVNSKRDTLRDFCSHLCKHAQAFLGDSHIRCRFDVQPNLPPALFDLSVRRGLFLAVKEALNNVAKHSGATEVFLRIFKKADEVVVVVEDNGRGFDPALLEGDRNGVINMQQRLEELGGSCVITSQPNSGTTVQFQVPLSHPASRAGFSWLHPFARRARRASAPSGESASAHPYTSS